ncbi:acyl-CoA reductase [Algoriphagus sp. NBT04N3]|jgi:hypothetical protein|uniref:acyl-CoA reductase n=1 Tax=Algoriphagus sp. NBT04N3 TaxID=2705473 RepID=UPI00351D41D3
MMELEKRIKAFASLGTLLSNLAPNQKEDLFRRSENRNNWFTAESCEQALNGLAFMLQESKLREWVSKYEFPQYSSPKDVGVLMAGNIPAVGFHDAMTGLLSGNKLSAKLSSADEVLMKWLLQQLIQLEPEFENLIEFSDMLKNKDAYIATGSDNSARYFNYYFGKYPSVIRQNRTSVAILEGDENRDDLVNLGKDIFSYYGLGCRNVSKIFIRNEEQLQQLLKELQIFAEKAEHHKYLNNYDYNKSIYLVNQDSHLDNGFLILKESQDLVSPIAVLYYELYSSKEALTGKIDSLSSKIQCVVGNIDHGIASVPFGQAQMPELWDYADGVDTLEFLTNLED